MTATDSNEPGAIHRLAKLMLDNGSASSAAAAEERLQLLRLRFEIDADEALKPAQQVALLTAVALARRVFLGGVIVGGALDVELLVPICESKTLRDAVVRFGGVLEGSTEDVPLVHIGGRAQLKGQGFAVRTMCAGWRGGIVPAHSAIDAPSADAMPLAAVVAAALAVNEAFLAVNGELPAAGMRSVGISLWLPGREDWISEDGGPALAILPSKLWLIGLGHLGQAYLWCLGVLPYRSPAQVELLLQDFDCVTASTWTTSMLTPTPLDGKPLFVGTRKTRLMAEWARQRGFSTTICERHFDATTRRSEREPTMALCGVDNAAARRALESAGFDFFVSAGLGSGHSDFRTIRVHTLPGERSAEEIWSESTVTPVADMPRAYKTMIDAGELDECGAALLAGVAVGAPFVGAIAAALSISEILRLLQGGQLSRLIDLDLACVEHKIVLPQKRDFSRLNPGFTSSK